MIPRVDVDLSACTIVYSPRLPEPSRVDEAASVLDAQERARAGRFRSERDAWRFLWRRALRRNVLAGVGSVDPAELAFASDCPRCGSTEHGKPRLIGAPHIHFSASQSGDATIVAVGPAPLGVDVQVVSADVRELAADVFSPREQAALAVSGKLADARRALLWARKEACLKAVGQGLAIEPATVDVLGHGFQDATFHPVEQLGQTVASWTVEEGSAVALAGATPRPVRFRTLAGSQLTAALFERGHGFDTAGCYCSAGETIGADLSRAR